MSSLSKVVGDISDPREAITFLKRRKWYIIVPILLVTLAAFGSTYFMTPVYESSVTLWMGNPLLLSNDIERMLGDFRNTLSSGSQTMRDIRGIKKELTSSTYIHQLVDVVGLYDDPEISKKANELLTKNPGRTLEELVFELWLRKLRNSINAEYVAANYLKISVEAESAELAKDLAENLGKIFIRERERQDQLSLKVSSNFSFSQLDKYEREVNDLVSQRTELEKQALRMQEQEGAALNSNKKNIEAEIQDARLTIEELENTERELVVELAGAGFEKPELEPSEAMKKDDTEIRSLYEFLRNSMQEQAWNDKEITKMKVRIFNREKDLAEEIQLLIPQQFMASDSVKAKLANLFLTQSRLAILYDHLNTLRLVIDSLENKLGTIPEIQVRIDQLNQKIQAARDLRDRFKQQQESYLISQAMLEESQYTVIEPADVPYSPIKPDKPRVALIGLVIGIMIGAAAAFLAELFDRSFRSVDDVEAFLGVEVLGTIPEVRQLRKVS